MTNKKISALTGATTPLAGTELVPVVQGGATVKVAVSDLTAGRVVSMSNLGVGVASPTYLADIQGTSGPSARIRSTPSTAGTATLLLEVANNFSGTSQSYVQGIGPGNSGISQLAFGVSTTSGATTATEVYRIDNTGNLLPKIAGNGINFTANTPAAGKTSQLLNWYEEGTWTPNQGSGLTVVGAFSSAGTYTKIGRIVVVNMKFIGATSISVPEGGSLCSNLPFSVLADGMGGYGCGQNSSTGVVMAAGLYGTGAAYHGGSTQTATAGNGFYFTVTYTATS